jgi:prepilin-type processing-associated H-X9-DG protein
MNRRVGAVVVVVMVLAAVAIGLPWLVSNRADSERVRCVNRLRELGGFAAAYAEPKKNKPLGPAAVPAGTLVNPDLPPEARLSWVPAALPFLDQRRVMAEPLIKMVNPALPWDAPPHADLARTKLTVLLCPGNLMVPVVGDPELTQYVGVAGLGTDAATLPMDAKRAGCFRYDAPTPLQYIADHDGLGQCLLFAETAFAVGPWLRGGPDTVRGLADGKAGMGDTFGGNHPFGGNVSFADGSTRFLTDKMNPAVLRALLTVNGGPAEVVTD